jgi:hypothetical protein
MLLLSISYLTKFGAYEENITIRPAVGSVGLDGL